MKKVLLVLVFLFISVWIFSEEVSDAKKLFICQANSESVKKIWDFTGTKLTVRNDIYNGETESVLVWGDSNDYDMVLKLKTVLTKNTTAIFNLDTTKDSYDNSFDVMFKYTINPQITAQIGLDVSTETGVNVKENKSKKKTFIKYKVNDSFSYSVHPYDIGLKIGDEFSLQGCQVTKVPGFILYMTPSKTLNYYFGLGGKETTENGENQALYALIAGGEYKAGNMTLKAAVSTNTEEDTYAYKKPVKHAGDISIEYTMGKYTINTELFAVQTIDFTGKISSTDEYATTTEENFDIGLYAKAYYDYGKLSENYSAYPFVSYKYTGADLYFDDDDSAQTVNGEITDHGGINSVSLGVELVNDILSVTPGIEYKMAGEDYFSGDDSSIYIFTEFSIEI